MILNDFPNDIPNDTALAVTLQPHCQQALQITHQPAGHGCYIGLDLYLATVIVS